jgi:tetratricopeptide (TPR) repeat protein
MGYKRIVLVLLLGCCFLVQAKPYKKDSLLTVIKTSSDEFNVAHARVLLALELMPADMDSGYALLKSASTDQIKDPIILADFHNIWGIYWWYSGMPEEAISCFNRTLEMKHTEKLLHHIAKASNNLGVLYNRVGKTDSAKYFLDKALEIDTQRGYGFGMAKTMYDLSIHHQNLNQNALALQYIQETIKIQESDSDIFRLANSINVRGNIFLELDSTQKAIESYRAAIFYAEKADIKSILANAYNNLAAIYCNNHGGFDSTLYYYNKAFPMALEQDNFYLVISLKINLGIAWLNKAEPGKALEIFNTALGYFGDVNDPIKETDVNLRIGKAKRELNKYNEAEYHIRRSLELARQINSLSYQSKAFFELSKIDSLLDDYRGAYNNFRMGVNLRDSIWNKETRDKIAELQIIHEADNNRLIIERLEKDNRLNKLLSFSGILVALLIFTVSAFFVKFYHKNQIVAKQQAIIQQQENEKFKTTLEANKQELTGKALTIVKLEEVIKQFRAELCLLMPQVGDDSARKIKEALSTIDINAKSQHMWKEFESRFNELNDGFINKLTALYPNLSPAEIRLCAMLRMQLSSKEIAELSNRSHRTIEYTRTNARKKMGLNPGDNLTKHLLSV